MSQPTVLILADDPEFTGAIMARWQAERSVPAFMLLSSAIWNDSLSCSCDLVVLGPVQANFGPILKALETSGRPVICVGLDPAQNQRLRNGCPRMTILRHHEGWVDAAVLLAGETLRRLEALARACRAEQALAESQADATLGRYMRDMRHNLNNALTSVLGNSELLLLEPGAFSAQQRDQISTMHTMAMRIHDVLQRFSLMESEIHLARPSHPEMAFIAEPAAEAN